MDGFQHILQNFQEIASIPRKSGNEQQIRNYIISRSKKNSYLYKIDKTGNILIKIPQKGKGRYPNTVILQSHLDMVCIGGNDEKETVLKIEGDQMSAYESTLGADNGIGIAMCLAIDKIEVHPSLELLFTVSEEVGLNGALNVDPTMVTGQYLINLDSEITNELCIGSAGGCRIEICLPYSTCHVDTIPYKLRLYGGKGGHSGVDIHRNRSNAILEMATLLRDCPIDYTLIAFNGGVADNVIPNETEAILSTAEAEKFKLYIRNFLNNSQNDHVDQLQFSFTKLDFDYIHETGIQEKKIILDSIIKIGSGAIKRHPKILNFVQTSVNLGMIQTESSQITLTYLPRSSSEKEMNKLINSIENTYKKVGTISINNRYPGREEDPESILVKKTKEVMGDILGQEPTVHAIHAGLECGALVDRCPTIMAAISIGPTITDAHTIHETLHIQDAQKTRKILTTLLKNL